MKDISNRCTSQPGFAPERVVELVKEIINDAQTVWTKNQRITNELITFLFRIEV
jgi:hypothetical protein